MLIVVLAIGVLLFSGLIALLLQGRPRAATGAGLAGTLLGCTMLLPPALQALLGGTTLSLHMAWEVPFGSLSLGLDALSAFFLIPIVILSAVAAIYGAQYLQAYRGQKSLGAPWFFYNLLLAGMATVTLARNGVLFLVAWEVMSLASFFLVTFEDEKPAVRQAGWTYLVATHIGTAFLLALFIVLGGGSGSLDFDRFARLSVPAASMAFLLAVIGFGTKAGFMPLHVWLPEAHPAAPSHVSAVMSGVMIKTGLYGLLRTLTFLGPVQAWWGWLLIGVGIASAFLGVLYALSQRDLKRLLAYSSVENVGIITIALGAGLLGLRYDMPVLTVLALAGGLLHIWNHAMFKGLLFLGAGSVLHATGSREIDHMGGLIKKMPWTAGAFLIGSAAIAALPPLNGFVSEFLVYLGAFWGAASGNSGGASASTIPMAIAGLSIIAALALVGGLVAITFTKAFGIVFLGEGRTDKALHAHESGRAMRFSMVLLAVACVALGLAGPAVLSAVGPTIALVTNLDSNVVTTAEKTAIAPMWYVMVLGLGALVVLALLGLLRRRLLKGRIVAEAGTWDCGYTRPSARIQYTGSSFTQPLTTLFSPLLRWKRKLVRPEGLFPQTGELEIQTPDMFRSRLFPAVFRGADAALRTLRFLQRGHMQLYVLYIALTLLVLLLWKLS